MFGTDETRLKKAMKAIDEIGGVKKPNCLFRNNKDLTFTEMAMASVEFAVAGRIGEMGVIVADHVIREGNHSLAGEADAAGGDAAILAVREAAVIPVAVSVQYSGEGAGAFAKRTVEIPGHVKSRQRLEVNFFDDVAFAGDGLLVHAR